MSRQSHPQVLSTWEWAWVHVEFSGLLLQGEHMAFNFESSARKKSGAEALKMTLVRSLASWCLLVLMSVEMVEYVPMLQAEQEVYPSNELVNTVAGVQPSGTGLNFPLGQYVQAVWPVSSENFPVAHAMQMLPGWSKPTTLEPQVPLGKMTVAGWGPPSPYLPMGQWMHVP